MKTESVGLVLETWQRPSSAAHCQVWTSAAEDVNICTVNKMPTRVRAK